MPINNPMNYGKSTIPSHIVYRTSYEIFSLFFTDDMLDVLAKHNDQHANISLRAAPKNQPVARQWNEITIRELEARSPYRSILLDGCLYQYPGKRFLEYQPY